WLPPNPPLRRPTAPSRCPMSVDRAGWLTGETEARFTVVLGGFALDASATCDDWYEHVQEVSLCSEDSEDVSIRGRDGLAAVAAAMGCARQSRGVETAARRRYKAFARGTAARKARRDDVVDLCCSCIAAAAFVGLLSTLTLQ
uniref:Uncharacterized protein n=1 Tax=Oryza brachyantha TaxID=4533 RepID=J3KV21_ORYBR